MTTTEMRVERVFPVSFIAGPIVWGTVRGDINAGDHLVLERPDGSRAIGRVVTVDLNRPANARDDQFGIAVEGELGDVVQVGDVVRVVPG